jgi:hypothetical protein
MIDNATGSARRRGRPPRTVIPEPKIAEEVFEAVEVAEAAPGLIERPSMRPAMREEDPRAAAARRAAEIRANQNPEDDGVDEFKLPPAPDGWTYEWKTKAVLGQVNHAHLTELKRVLQGLRNLNFLRLECLLHLILT